MDSWLTRKGPQDHNKVGPLTKKGHITVLNMKRRIRRKRSRQKFGHALAEIATSVMPKLIAAIYNGSLKHKQIEKMIKTPIIFARGSRWCIQVPLSR
jgi:hypothetical protein